MPKISIIIPSYNHAQYLDKRIESILNQSFEDIEIIILEDCSTDESRSVIDKYRNHPLIKEIVFNNTNSGSTFKQWEKGIALAKGEWVWIAESDDYADYDFLKILTARIAHDTGVIYCRSNLINENGDAIKLYNFSSMPDPNVYNDFKSDFKLAGHDFVKQFMLGMNSIPNASAVIFKRDLVQQAIFNRAGKTKLFGDWIFWLHLLKQTNILYLSQPLNYFRFHGNTVRNDTHFTSTRLREYMVLVKYFENEFGFGKEALDCLLFHYLSGEIPSSGISFSDHCKINFFVFRRNPMLLIKSYFRKVKNYFNLFRNF